MYAYAMIIEKAKIVEGGRIVIPARFRIVIRPARAALRRIQKELEPFRPNKRALADELVADRRIGEARER